MKKILYFISILFVLTVSDASSQTKVESPWMFYPQQTSFVQSPYCKKYGCADSQFRNSPSTNMVTNHHTLFNPVDGAYKGPFDIIRSAFYTVSTIRYPFYPKSKFGVLYSSLSMDGDVRYVKLIADDLPKGILDPRIYALVSDYLFSMVGRRYSKSQIIECYQFKGDTQQFDEFRVSSDFPVSQLPVSENGPGPFMIYISISCNGLKSESEGSDLLEIRLFGPAALDGVPRVR
jgi:hypothetical protein